MDQNTVKVACISSDSLFDNKSPI